MITEDFIKKHVNNLIDCVNIASVEIMKIYRSDNFGQEEKSDGSPLTMADTKSNEIIMNALKKISVDIPIISEENFKEDNLKNLSKTYWLVDPLDGTKEFINKTDEFTVNIALIENKQSESTSSKKIRIVMSKSHKGKNDNAFLEFLESKGFGYEVIEKGSSLKLCSLADNHADIYPRFGPTSEWDIAAAHAVLSSYGGSVIKIKENAELDYAKESSILNPYFIAFRNNAIKSEFLPHLRDFFKKLVRI